MTIKKLPRYQVMGEACCDADDVTELEATNAELAKALSNLMGLIMHPSIEADETIKEIVAARKALKSARGE